MQENKLYLYLSKVLEHMPSDWLGLTTHRLDIYDEERAKSQFLEGLDELYMKDDASKSALASLPTAYDYIRLGHPLSCVLEWAMAKRNGNDDANIISFSSQTTPLLAILRANLLRGEKTTISGDLPTMFDPYTVQRVYGYSFELLDASQTGAGGKHVHITTVGKRSDRQPEIEADFSLAIYPDLGSVLEVHGTDNDDYISEIQHVRRRETIAMTPADCLIAIQMMIGEDTACESRQAPDDRKKVKDMVRQINGVDTKVAVGSSGLSIQYAIMMGLVQDALDTYPGKDIKFVVPPNCYGGTNDQARRVAACLPQVAIVDLPVDAGNDMVNSVDRVLDEIAVIDAVPYIIAEIPTNPRVEVPDLAKLKSALERVRYTAEGTAAVPPVFILDQTFCPNVHFLGEGKLLSGVKAISYASGSKFPSGGKCTAGYCIANPLTDTIMDKIEAHLSLCDNEATELQYQILAEQMPSMIDRIQGAYTNTRAFVNFITQELPAAKINFVSEALAAEGFTPSVFSLDLPTWGVTDEEREMHKRASNLKLIDMMISQIPNESKFCVSYGQLKGCYWTIPATSTQGTTKEDDKDYIVRASLSADMDMEKHMEVFSEFVSHLSKQL